MILCALDENANGVRITIDCADASNHDLAGTAIAVGNRVAHTLSAIYEEP